MKNDDAMPEVEAREWLYAPSQALTPVTGEEVDLAFDAFRKAMDDAHAAAPGQAVNQRVGILAALNAVRNA